MNAAESARPIRNGLWNGFATAVVAVVGVVGSILIVRNLSPQQYGALSYYAWLASLLSVLGILAFPKALTKITAELRGQQQEGQARALIRAVFSGLFSLNIVISLAIVIWALSSEQPRRTYLLLVALVPPFHAVLRVSISTFWGQERYKPVALATAVPALIQLGLIVATTLRGWGVSGYLIATFSVNVTGALILMAYGLLMRNREAGATREPLARRNVRYYLAFTAPATLLTLVDAVVWQRSEVFFLERFSSTEEIGYYSLAFSVYTMTLILGLALVNGFYPALSRHYGAKDWGRVKSTISQAILLATIFAVPLALGGWVTLGHLITVLYGSKMAPSILVAQLLFFGLLFAVLAEVFSITFGALNRLWLGVRLGVIAAAINIGLNLLLIPRFGALGGAVANTVAQVSFALAAFFVVRALTAAKIPWLALGGIGVIGLLTTFLLPDMILRWNPSPLGLGLAIAGSGASYLTLLWLFGYVGRLRGAVSDAGKLKVLHILGDRRLPPEPDSEGISGVVRAALQIARQQSDLGHEVTVVTVGARPYRSSWHGVTLRCLKSPPRSLFFGRRVLDFRLHLPLVLFTARHDYDIVHCHHYGYLRFLRARGRVVHFHGDPFHAGSGHGDPSLTQRDFRLIARTSDAQVGVSRFVSQQLRLGFGNDRPYPVVRNGIDLALFDADRLQEARATLRQHWQADDADCVFLFVGAIVPEKGLLHLARAFAAVSADLPEAQLVVAGGRHLWGGVLATNDPHLDYENSVVSVLAPHLHSGRVHWLGVIPSTEVAAVYAASDVVIVPSVYQEAFGLVALEGLAAGRPVIASEVGGLGELVDERCGVLIPPGDEEALARALRRLAADPKLRQSLGEHARQRAAEFSWHEAAKQFEAIYWSILKGDEGVVPAGTLDTVPQ